MDLCCAKTGFTARQGEVPGAQPSHTTRAHLKQLLTLQSSSQVIQKFPAREILWTDLAHRTCPAVCRARFKEQLLDCLDPSVLARLLFWRCLCSRG